MPEQLDELKKLAAGSQDKWMFDRLFALIADIQEHDAEVHEKLARIARLSSGGNAVFNPTMTQIHDLACQALEEIGVNRVR